MRLTKEQRIEIILMAGSGSSRMVARNFNRKHGTALEGHGVPGKDTGHKSSHGTYYHDAMTGITSPVLMRVHQ